MKPLVVVDTNVFVSALMGSGSARRVLAACLRRQTEPLMGTTLLAEYESLIHREELQGQYLLSPLEREALLDDFLAVCRWTRIYFFWRPNLPDEADNHVLELALAGGAEAIITANVRDFTRGELRFSSPRILTPRRWLEEKPWLI